jgi:outer membrane protein assembly factor BamB
VDDATRDLRSDAMNSTDRLTVPLNDPRVDRAGVLSRRQAVTGWNVLMEAPMRRNRFAPALLAAVLLVAVAGTTPATARTQPTGAVQWVTDLGHGAVSGPTLGKDLLYVGTGEGTVEAVDPVTGELVWVTDLTAFGSVTGAATTPALGKDVLYTGTSGGQLIALR